MLHFTVAVALSSLTTCCFHCKQLPLDELQGLLRPTPPLTVLRPPPGKDLFDGALHHFWKGYSRVSREKVPSHITVGGNPVDTWVFWREVWAWGGPEEVQKNKVSALEAAKGGGVQVVCSNHRLQCV